jgi:hypothetical protein
MAGEITVTFGTEKTLEANGAAIANNNVGQADDATYSVAADGANFPDARFVLSFAFGTAPAENTSLVLLARPLNIDGTADSEPPENGAATFKGRFMGAFTVNNVTTTQYAVLTAYDLPREAEYFVWNNGTGQSLSAGWTLKVLPRTYVPA